MKIKLFCVVFVLFAAASVMAVASAEPVALLADPIIDGNSSRAVQNAAVVVDGEKIIFVGDRNEIPADARRIDLGDATLMPGMEGTLLEDERNNYYIEHERPTWFRWLKKAHEKGVKIGVGVDFGGQGYEPHVFAREFRTLTEVGMSNMEAILAGTRVNAEMLGWDDRLGTLQAGKLADIIAVPGDPLEDISLLEQTSFVMLGGKIFRSPDREAALSGMLQ